ncbi:MAG: methyltransferase domain-containing protein [Beijerinckiaceae bacterium]
MTRLGSGLARAPSASSGDLQADRRFLYAERSAAEGDRAAAADLLEQCLELAPHWAPAWFALGAAREQLSLRAAAINAYEQALACDPADELGASLALARIGAALAPASAAPAYVARLFDQYAPRFDVHLVERLGYRAPSLLHAAIADACGRTHRAMRFRRALDLGCGTGLAGASFRGCAEHLEGVDLSAGMIAKARAKGIYDQLRVGDIVDHLRATGDGAFDLIFAADVLVYIGDITPLLRQAARVLVTGGFLAFTAECHDGEGYVVGRETRYAHSRSYIENAAREMGVTLHSLQDVSTRQNKGAEVPGIVAVMSI